MCNNRIKKEEKLPSKNITKNQVMEEVWKTYFHTIFAYIYIAEVGI